MIEPKNEILKTLAHRLLNYKEYSIFAGSKKVSIYNIKQ